MDINIINNNNDFILSRFKNYYFLRFRKNNKKRFGRNFFFVIVFT